MEPTTNKNRTQSRCREWERKRRNKFNDAISRLGEIVKEINKANQSSANDSEDIQYPKVEIVEKAIICLTTCAQDKAQLKAEVLALQVKIEAEKNNKQNKKDASTQVFIGINRKKPNGKYVKVLMLQKSKRNALKEKSVLTTNVTVESKVENTSSNKKIFTPKTSSQKLPTLLPRSTLNVKKGSENTFVVLPATPYIFPQRPLIFPTAPPAFVLVDPNLQALNKPSFPLVNRNNGDITKTTMVNILPISAYSRPLSATKTKKNGAKSKIDAGKKTKNKNKQVIRVNKESVTPDTDKAKIGIENISEKETSNDKLHEPQKTTDAESIKINDKTTLKDQDISSPKKNLGTCCDESHKSKSNLVANIPKVVNLPKNSDTNPVEITTSSITLALVHKSHDIGESIEGNSKTNKFTSEKITAEDKVKENKLPNILDTTLCENVVDGGNARLELAEEFLAASPTAAFLMSFPLVSGNRADSPADEPQNTIPINTKENNPRRNEMPSQSIPYFEKHNSSEIKAKPTVKSDTPIMNIGNKQNEQHKYIDSNGVNKQVDAKTSHSSAATNVSNENPFLNLTMSSLIPASCTLTDASFGLDFDCNINKTISSQPTSYVSSSNLFYKSDPFSTVKSSIYSTSSISSGHEFNSFGLYPCAMEKYASKNKTDYPNVEENLMKIGSSRLTYDIDLGWSHKSLDFASCTNASNTFNKDNILTTATGPYSTAYNPFNPEFHVPLVTNSNKKDNSSSKPNSFTDTITNFYSQPTNLWSEDVPFYSNNSVSKTLTTKHQNYLPVDHVQTNVKPNITKPFEAKHETVVDNIIKSSNIGVTQQISDKYTKKSPSKMHINWMTSEIRPLQNNCIPSHTEMKNHKPSYVQVDHVVKKQNQNENNYFPLAMHNFPSQSTQEEIQVWPSARPAGTTEISIEPPPINLPTLVGDLALGPHDKKKNVDPANRGVSQSDIQNCSNFFSVTQLMNRSTNNNIPPRYQGPNNEALKSIPTKQNITHTSNDSNRKGMSRLESHLPQPCYVFNDSKPANSYEIMGQYSQVKNKTNKADKSTKVQKNSYSAEALIRGGTCTQKLQDNNNTKFMMPPPQKYNDFNVQDSGVAQVSHFPPILDYSDNNFTGQQFSGTTLYNSTTNTISNSFYTNFMPGSSNLMSGNYSSGPFSGDFIDYNQTPECNYTNHKYDELKMRNNPPMFQQEKMPSNYKSSRRESSAKHKLECSKKESSKKYQSKRPKLNPEIEEWNDTSHSLWQNKTPRRHTNLMTEELPFPNYVGNQMAAQYQPEFFNSHLMPSNVQSVGHNVDRSFTSFPATSRANFNLSTIFPEITMKVQ